jgi:hypothetical protein
MADFENNVHHLATVRINERNPRIVLEVATDLVAGALAQLPHF